MTHELRFTRGEIAALLEAAYMAYSTSGDLLALETAIQKLEAEAELLR